MPAHPGRDEPGLRLRRRRLLQRRPGHRHLPGDHWNLYDNRFLTACADAAPACGGTTAPETNPQPPVSTTQPAIAGDARVGSVLTALTGSWTNAPTAFQYQWEQGDGRPGWPSPARPARPTPSPARTSACACALRVIAVNADGASAAYSLPTAT